jgi:hypothetical protein
MEKEIVLEVKNLSVELDGEEILKIFLFRFPRARRWR